MNRYPTQTLVRLSVAFTDLTGAPVDPTTVTVTVTPPDQAAQLITNGISHDGVGLYHYDQTVDRVGVWQYRWQGSGAAIAATPALLFQGI